MASNIIVINLNEVTAPKYKRTTGEGKGYLTFGDKNNYPQYLVDLFEQSSTHGSITKGKISLIKGKGFAKKGSDTDPNLEAFIKYPNPYENLNSILEKCVTDLEVFGGFYLQVLFSKFGLLSSIYHLPFETVRTNRSNTQFWYKQSWDLYNREEAKAIPGFDPDSGAKKQVYLFKEQRPGLDAYPLPSYMHGIIDIESDIEISKGINSNAKSGFRPSKSISIYDAPDSEEAKKEIEREIKKKFTGSTGQKVLVSFPAVKEQKPDIDDLGESDISREDFTAISNVVTQKIFTAHQVTSPLLFGIKTEGQLGGNNELVAAYEIFKALYGQPKQLSLEETFTKLAKLRGAIGELQILEVDPVSLNLDAGTISQTLTIKEIREKAGLAPYHIDGNNDFSDFIEKLSSLPPDMAKKLIDDLNPDQIRSIAGIQNPVKVAMKDDLSIFEEFGENKANYIPLHTRKINFSSDGDMAFDEENTAVLFLEMAAKNLTTLELNILDLISKDKRITPEVIADTLSVKIEIVKRVLNGLIEKNLLTESTDKISTSRTLTKSLTDIKDENSGSTSTTTNLRIMYTYAGPMDSKNRPFCKKLMELDRYYTRSDIETISQRVGYSVFDRCGGWYTVPGTNEHRPKCRHTWESHIVLKNNN